MNLQRYFKTCEHQSSYVEAREYYYSDGNKYVVLLCSDCVKSDIFNGVPHRVLGPQDALDLLRGVQ